MDRFGYLNSLLEKYKNRRTVRRIIALLSCVTILITMNSLTFEADTISRIPTCGIAEHIHVDECYDETGAIVCGYEAHVHTDACFQERPTDEDVELYTAENGLSSEQGIGVDQNAGAVVAEEVISVIEAPVAEIDSIDLEDVVSVDVEAPAEEVELFDLSEINPSALEEPLYNGNDGFLVSAETSIESEPFYFRLAEPLLISSIANELHISIDEVVEVAPIVKDEEAESDPVIGVEILDSDYLVYALRDFELAELAVVTENDILVLNMFDGVAIGDRENAEDNDAVVEIMDEEQEIIDARVDQWDEVEISGREISGEGAADAGEDEHTVDQQPVDGDREIPVVTDEEARIEGIEPAEEAEKTAEGEKADESGEKDEIIGDAYKDDAVVEAEGANESDVIFEADKVYASVEAEDADVPVDIEDAEKADMPVETEKAEMTDAPVDAENAEKADASVEAEDADVPVDTEDAEKADMPVETEEADKTDASMDDEYTNKDDIEQDTIVDEDTDHTKEKLNDRVDGAEEKETTDEADVGEDDDAGEGSDTDGDGDSRVDEHTDADEGEHTDSAEDIDAEEHTDADEDAEKTDTEDAEADAPDAEDDGSVDSEAEDGDDGEEQAEGSEPKDDGSKPTADGVDDHAVADDVLDITYDLAEAEGYPLSLRALIGDAIMSVPAGNTGENTVEEAVDAALDDNEAPVGTAQDEAYEDQTEMGEAEEAQIDVAEVQIGDVVSKSVEAPAKEIDIELGETNPSVLLPISFDEALISVETTEDDYLLTVVAAFDQTAVTVGPHTITLLNGSTGEAYPAQAFMGSTDHVAVNVSAPEGAFPAGTTMVVADVDDDETIIGITDKVEEDFIKVERVHAVDITFLDVDSLEIEPLIPISVVMSVRGIEEVKETVVVHVDDAGEAQVVEDTVVVDAPVELEESVDHAVVDELSSSLEFTADAFSVYAVVVGEKLETKVLGADGETYHIEVTYTEDANIPAGATLLVEEVTGEEELARIEQNLPGNKMITLARFFDIKIMNDGEEVQPETDVQVKVWLEGMEPVEVQTGENETALDMEEPVEMEAVELTEDGAQAEHDVQTEKELQTGVDHTIITSEPVPAAMHFTTAGDEPVIQERQAGEDENAVIFTAEGFSVWGIVYTVDFYYGNYEYHLDGEKEVLLSALLEALEIDVDAALVEEAVFTDPDLVAVEKLEADWMLTSLKPFESHEKLTVVLTDGTVYEIAVDDAQITARVLTADGETFIVTVTYGPEAEIPEDAKLEAREITIEEEKYSDLLAQAGEALKSQAVSAEVSEDVPEANGAEETAEASMFDLTENQEAVEAKQDREIAQARFFDIGILADGAPIEPAAAVQVSIAYAEPMETVEGDIMTVVHFADQGTEVIVPETVENETGVSEVIFETESFSDFGAIQERMTETISDGLIAFFSFDEYNDLKGRNANGQVVAHLQPVPANVGDTGSYGYGVENGLNLTYMPNVEDNSRRYFILVDDNKQPLLNTTNVGKELTVSYWANLTNATNEKNWGFFIYPEGVNAQAYGSERYLGVLHQNKDNQTVMERYDSEQGLARGNGNTNPGAIYAPYGNATYIGNGVWHHIVAVYGESDMKLYIDGELRGTTNNHVDISTLLSSGSVFQIGKGNWENGEYFVGRFDDLGIYNRALTADEVANLYQAYHETPVTAKKLSIREMYSEAARNADAEFILYVRKLNTETSEYELYAVASDGRLVRAYDMGDYVGYTSTANLKWKFYQYTDGSGYVLRNTAQENARYSQLLPQESGRVTVNEDVYAPLKLSGLVVESYSTYIENATNGYGFGYDDVLGRITSVTGDQIEEFYFASVYDVNLDADEQKTLTTVETIDNHEHGITIKMFDYAQPDAVYRENYSNTVTSADGEWDSDKIDAHALSDGIYKRYYTVKSDGSYDYMGLRSAAMSMILGSSAYVPGTEGIGGHATMGIVGNQLINGYPNVIKTGYNLSTLFGNSGQLYKDYWWKGEANHLFLQSVYDETGYFEYNSANNYAWLNPDTHNFEVYEQVAAAHLTTGNNVVKGNFLPFNDLKDTVNVTVGSDKNLRDINGELISQNDPRYDRDMYYVHDTDYFFGMSMDVDFVQAKNGISWNGDPVVFEFNGDDDMWVYIDDVLVLDIGGVHGPVKGAINFNTGHARVYGVENYDLTLRQLFEASGKYTSEQLDDMFTKSGTFKNYGTHTLRMFYMERGEGASNLYLRFNLPTIEPGRFVLEKTLENTDKTAYANVRYAYQVYTKDAEHPEGTLVNNDSVVVNAISKTYAQRATYKGTTTPLAYDASATINGKTYSNVFYLRPGEAAEFILENDEMEYEVREIGVYDEDYHVWINDAEGHKLTISGATQESNSHDISSDYMPVDQRPILNITNKPLDHKLKILKVVDADDKEADAVFSFRVWMENTNGYLTLYSNAPYYIKDAEGRFYKRDQNGNLIQCEEADDGRIFYTDYLGAVANIPEGYYVVIDQLLPGTHFRVDEIALPYGYQYTEKDVEGEDESTGGSWLDGRIPSGKADPTVLVTFHNSPVNHIIVKKAWVNAGKEIKAHGQVKVALFKASGTSGEPAQTTYVLVPNTTKTLTAPNYEAEFIVPGNLFDYAVFEVDDSNQPVASGNTIIIAGETLANDAIGSSAYIVSYSRGSETAIELKHADENHSDVYGGGHARTDTITNTLPKFSAKKTDLDGNALNGAVFELKRMAQGDEGLENDESFEALIFTSATTETEEGVIFKDQYLPSGIYVLTETNAPSGYNLLTKSIRITVDDSGIGVEYDDGSDSSTLHVDGTTGISFSIPNSPGVKLPATGGPGTPLYTILGSLLILGAAFLLLRKRQY